MKYNSLFYNNLRSAFISCKSSFLNKKLFIETHFSKEEKQTPEFISHRCSQWLSDLKSMDRRQSLLIEDLELLCDAKKQPASIVLNDSRYWDQSIEYVNEEFLDLVLEMCENAQAENNLENVFFPILFDPKTNVVLAAAIIHQTKPSAFDNIIHFADRKENSLQLCFVVHSLNATVDTFVKKTNPNRYSHSSRVLYNYKEALDCFRSICNYERCQYASIGLGYQLEKTTRCIKYYFQNGSFFKRTWRDVFELLKKQNLFLGFFPNLIKGLAGEEIAPKTTKNNLNITVDVAIK